MRTPSQLSLPVGVGVVIAVVAVLSLVSAGCGAAADPADFTVDTETGFLAACADPIADSALTNAICRCVFEEMSAAYTFNEFEALDDELRFDLGSELPDDIEAMIASCIIEEADL